MDLTKVLLKSFLNDHLTNSVNKNNSCAGPLYSGSAGFCIYAARQIHEALFRQFALVPYSALFCRILENTWQNHSRILIIGWFSLSVIESAVECFNRVGSDSGVGLASLEWGQAPKPPSFVALRATTQSTRSANLAKDTLACVLHWPCGARCSYSHI